VLEPTRQLDTLDLVAIPETITRVKVIPRIRDHDIVFLELNVRPDYRKQPQRKVWLYRKADWIGMTEYLGPRLARLEQAYIPSSDVLWTSIKNEVTEAINQFIPKRQTRCKDSHPWFDSDLHQLLKKKRYLYKRCKKRGSLHLEKGYNMTDKLQKRCFGKKHAKYVHRMFTDADKTKKELSKHFWTYIKHKRSSAISTVGPLKRDNILVTTSKVKATFSIISSYLSSLNQHRS
jgi:hypothetical protein